MTGTAVRIFKPYDVILAEIAPRLHLDNFQRNSAGVGEAVNFTERYVGRLVFAEQEGLVAAGDLGRTRNDDPVLRTVMVFLQAEAGARFDLDTLDLEALLLRRCCRTSPRGGLPCGAGHVPHAAEHSVRQRSS